MGPPESVVTFFLIRNWLPAKSKRNIIPQTEGGKILNIAGFY